MGKILSYCGKDILALRKLDKEFDLAMMRYEELLEESAFLNQWNRYYTIVLSRLRYLEDYFNKK